MFKKLRKFIEESIQELKKVSWPKKDEIIGSTIITIIAIIIMSSVLGIFDLSFYELVKFLMS